MKILVTGSRDWDDEGTIIDTLVGIYMDYPVDGYSGHVSEEFELIEGGARGADKMAAACAKALGWKVTEVPADWKRYGKPAGPIRNQEMLDMDPDLVLAFHPNLKESKGTKDMVNRAEKKGVKVILISGKY